MDIKHNDIEKPDENPFKFCKLERRPYAEILTSIVGQFSDGFVMAINNEWGTGKTTFVEMWQKHLQNNNFKTLYFNAWENDFEENPLVAIISELKTLLKKNDKLFLSVVEKGAVFTKSILPDLIKAFASKYVDTEAVLDAIKNASDSGTEILQNEIKEYTKKKDGLKEFRESLTKYVAVAKAENLKENEIQKPIVFIIDELDRCRPNYAVELLEQIKHLFNVPGIVFVLSIDKTQLGNAVRGVYGSDLINADEYLRRFIDIEYSIPPPKPMVFCSYLFGYFKFSDFFRSHERIQHYEFQNDVESFIGMAALLFEKSNLTLRQQEKIFAHARLGLLCFSFREYVFPSLYFLLIFIKTFHNVFYNRIRNKMLASQELIDEFYAIMPKELEPQHVNGFIRIEALFSILYNNSIRQRGVDRIITLDKVTKKEISSVVSKFDKSTDQSTFISYVRNMYDSFDYGSTEIGYLIHRIDLTTSLTIN